MDENNIIKKKSENYHRHNQNDGYYNNKKKKNLIEDNSEEKEDILLFEEEVKPTVLKQVIEENVPDYEEIDMVPVKKTKKHNWFNKSFLKYGLGFAILIIAVFGVSYSYFNYSSEDSRRADISSGSVYVRIVENEASITLNKMYPRTTEEARAKSDNYVDFTIEAKNTSPTQEIFYSLDVTNGEDVSGKTRINPQYIKIDLQEKINNEYVYINNADTLSNFNFSSKVLINTTNEIRREFRLRIWVSDDIIISDTETGASYTQQEFANLYANYNITVNSGDRSKTLSSEEKVKEAIANKINAAAGACTPVWKDDINNTPSDDSDDIWYFSGDNTCVDMNYVWYSGKLWRITAIYPDGTMKLVTEDNITSISWGSNVEYDGSWVYQWLNEDFYDTLYNANNFIESSTWNYSTDENSTPVKPETIETQKTKVAPVGLLNAYEYYNAYRNATTSSNYLNIGYFWWLITPYSSSNIHGVNGNGRLNNAASSSTAYVVRPSIVIKAGLDFTGSGTIDSPYKIVGDKKEITSGTTLLSSRSIGEYVKFDDDLYRIVDTTSGITKLTRVDYLKESGSAITKYLASSSYYGKNGNTATTDYWDYYLNNTWYGSITSTYKSMLVDGTYYLGLYPNNTSYKATICKDATLDSVTTKNCTKYTNSDADKTFTGKVGLPRLGEMFSSQLDNSSSSSIWTVTPFSASNVRYIHYYGYLGGSSPSSSLYAVRPSITLKAGIKITSGTGYVGGSINSPFEISA